MPQFHTAAPAAVIQPFKFCSLYYILLYVFICFHANIVCKNATCNHFIVRGIHTICAPCRSRMQNLQIKRFLFIAPIFSIILSGCKKLLYLLYSLHCGITVPIDSTSFFLSVSITSFLSHFPYEHSALSKLCGADVELHPISHLVSHLALDSGLLRLVKKLDSQFVQQWTTNKLFQVINVPLTQQVFMF